VATSRPFLRQVSSSKKFDDSQQEMADSCGLACNVCGVLLSWH
jgi:hypothetical protein